MHRDSPSAECVGDFMSLITVYNSSFKSMAKSAGAVLYLDARKATGNSKPINSPLTNPWTDLSGLGNNATPTNMAGTTVSGVDTTDSSKPFWVLDGTDDFFNLVNTASVDITASPLAVFATIRADVGAGNGYIICKNVDSSTNMQYGIHRDGTNSNLNIYLEGLGRKNTTSNTVPSATWFNVGFIWDGTNVKAYINCIQSGTAGSYSGALTGRANAQIGCRSGAGATKATFFRGNIATASIYTGAKATESNVLKAEKAISKAYIGG